jgi:hypothetical protein
LRATASNRSRSDMREISWESGKWERNTGTQEHRRPTRRAGRMEASRAARGADRQTKSHKRGWPGAAGERWAGPGSQALESGPIPDGAFLKPVSGGPSKAESPFCGMLGRGVDILHRAPVNAPAARGSNRRNPLAGWQLRSSRGGGTWDVHTQARVDTRSLEIRVQRQRRRGASRNILPWLSVIRR